MTKSSIFVFNNFSRVISLMLVMFFVCTSENSFATFTKKKAGQKQSFEKMNQTKKKAVPSSVWGGDGISLTVESKGVKIQYDCAEAEITEKLMIDEKGNFSIKGKYLRRNPGAIRLKMLPKPQPAKFVGKIMGKKMMLKVILTENDEEVGDFQLQRGKTAKIRRCL